MKVYLIRHGESVDNIKSVHQTSATPLSKQGLSQVKVLAKRCRSLPVNIIIASPFERTKQTAEAIADTIKKDVKFEELFREIKRPTEIEGKKVDDPEAVAIKSQISLHNGDPSWHYSDEETLFEIRDRAVKALEFLKELGSENVLAVTHSHFLVMLMAVMLYGEDLQPKDYLRLRRLLHTSNTGITVCEYNNGQWELLTWNDQSHLG